MNTSSHRIKHPSQDKFIDPFKIRVEKFGGVFLIPPYAKNNLKYGHVKSPRPLTAENESGHFNRSQSAKPNTPKFHHALAQTGFYTSRILATFF